MLSIRKARASDASTLADLNNEFNHVRMAPSAIVRKLSNKNEITLLAQFGVDIVGFACAQIYGSICYPEPQTELTELFVIKEFRRMGIATRLCRTIESEAARRNALEIHLLTNRRNAHARALYESLGYKAKNDLVYAKDIKQK
jgi:ribosomal protein S18 acetylase RimI-like enzyme